MMLETTRIHRLSKEVVNRIAAGEVIQRPANAIKELLENSIDAGSTSIHISVKGGGLKFLQIKDNGHGILKDDLPIVCERFTTSKLSCFEDLSGIATFGFRGEALASITHIAHLSITTMTEGDECAWKASYRDGKLLDGKPPAPSAGVKGTQITIEDMFYNVSSRRKVLQKPNEEYGKIVDVVTKYALHNSGIGFNLKKQGANNSEVSTASSNSILDNIRILYSPALSRELMQYHLENDKYSFAVDGYISKPTYHSRKSDFILFINSRLVDCRPLKRAVELPYSEYLNKSHRPFIYLSLTLKPKDVDVNVHPTKSEVRFLHQAEIIDVIASGVNKMLQDTNTERCFLTQTLLTRADSFSISKASSSSGTQTRKRKELNPATNSNDEVATQKSKIRKDSRDQSIQSFLMPFRRSGPRTRNMVLYDPANTLVTDSQSSSTESSGAEYSIQSQSQSQSQILIKSTFLLKNDDNNKGNDSKDPVQTSLADIKFKKHQSHLSIRRSAPLLTSVKLLLKDVTRHNHPVLQRLCQDNVFVGCVSDVLILLQHGAELFLCNISRLSQEFLYQEVLRCFGEFPTLQLSTPVSVRDLCRVALELPSSGWSMRDGSKENVAKYVERIILNHREMIKEYFNITINKDGMIVSLPQIIPEHTPDLGSLPMFILRLGTGVDWNTEQLCFSSLARELSFLYRLPPADESVDYDDDINEENTRAIVSNKRKWTIEHVFLPAFREHFQPPRACGEDGSVVRVASLEKLYKVFERC